MCMDKIAAVKQSVSIIDVLSMAGLRMDRSGFIPSPFKKEKTPSCKIYEKSNTWKDYSSGEHGDQIDLYCALKGVDKRTAINDLSRGLVSGFVPVKKTDARIDVDKLKVDELLDEEIALYNELFDGGMSEKKAERFVVLKRMELNSEIFEALYDKFKDDWDPNALLYLTERRGLSMDTLRKFKVFCLNDYDGVVSFLRHSFSKERLFASGLINEKGNLVFYRHRILIPYLFHTKIVYMRGRAWFRGSEKCDGSKYIGLRNDALRVNGARRLFNLDTIENMINGQTLYVTEGEFDAMAVEQVGYKAVGVPGANNLPEARKLHRLKGFNIVMLADNDQPGMELCGRVAGAMKEFGVTVHRKVLPDGCKDMNEFLVQRLSGARAV